MSLTIENFKSTMIAKAKKRGLYENFGVVELRKLKEKHDYFGKSYSQDEMDKEVVRELDELDEWCMNLDLSQL